MAGRRTLAGPSLVLQYRDLLDHELLTPLSAATRSRATGLQAPVESLTDYVGPALAYPWVSPRAVRAVPHAQLRAALLPGMRLGARQDALPPDRSPTQAVGVHAGTAVGPRGSPLAEALLVGGGSGRKLPRQHGPQFVALRPELRSGVAIVVLEGIDR